MLLLLFLWCCRATPLLPPVQLPPDTLLLREWLVLGTERTAGRRDRFDRQGCWSQAPNTWLWVHDPVLAQAQDPWLFLNGRWETEPWFCLSQTDRWRLERAVDALEADPPTPSLPASTQVVLRYAAQVDGELRVAVAPLGLEGQQRPTAELATLLASLAAEGAWAASPEDSTPAGSGRAGSTAAR